MLSEFCFGYSCHVCGMLPLSCLGRPQISYKHASIGHSLQVLLQHTLDYFCAPCFPVRKFNFKFNLLKRKPPCTQCKRSQIENLLSNPISLSLDLPPHPSIDHCIVLVQMHFHKDLKFRLTRHGLIFKELTFKQKYAKSEKKYIHSQKTKYVSK